MELKIRIKEVKEETRELNVFEEALVLAVQPRTICSYYPQFVDRCKNKLRELGLSVYEDDYSGGYGEPFIWTFRTETIRDATPDEVIAWHILAVDKACWNHDCEICNIGKVYSCLYCVCDSNEANNARELLKDKEVILELVD